MKIYRNVPPHEDVELTHERKKCLMRYFDDVDVKRQENIEFANFSDEREDFADVDDMDLKHQHFKR